MPKVKKVEKSVGEELPTTDRPYEENDERDNAVKPKEENTSKEENDTEE